MKTAPRMAGLAVGMLWTASFFTPTGDTLRHMFLLVFGSFVVGWVTVGMVVSGDWPWEGS